MKLLWVFLALTLIILPLEIHAQSLSELGNQLDQKNLEKAQSFSQTSGCPEGMEAKVRGVEVICVKETTSQKSESNSQTNLQFTDIQLTDEQWMYVGIGIVVFIIIIAVIVKASQSKPESYKDVRLKRFTHTTKNIVKKLQKGKCADCGTYPTHWEFDHIHTRGDNSIDNCQGLCRDCHQDKTLDDNWGNNRN